MINYLQHNGYSQLLSRSQHYAFSAPSAAVFGWRPLPDTGIYANVQYLCIRSKDDAANFLGLMLMGEKFVELTLPLRLGVTIDSAAQTTTTIDLGLHRVKGINNDINARATLHEMLSSSPPNSHSAVETRNASTRTGPFRRGGN